MASSVRRRRVVLCRRIRDLRFVSFCGKVWGESLGDRRKSFAHRFEADTVVRLRRASPQVIQVQQFVFESSSHHTLIVVSTCAACYPTEIFGISNRPHPTRLAPCRAAAITRRLSRNASAITAPPAGNGAAELCVARI